MTPSDGFITVSWFGEVVARLGAGGDDEDIPGTIARVQTEIRTLVLKY
jgi:hypothetical protein